MSRPRANRLWTFWLESGRAHACALLCDAIADALYECETVWVTVRTPKRRYRLRVVRLIPNMREAHPRTDFLRHCPYCGHVLKDLALRSRGRRPAPLCTLVVPDSLPPEIH